MLRTSFAAKAIGVVAASFLLFACSSKKEAETAPVDQGSMVDNSLEGQWKDMQRVGDRVYFDLDRYDVRPEGMATLQKQAQFLNEHPELTVRVEGHCDERGTREYNLALGDRRANAVREALVSLGVDRGRLSTISYGKDRPECSESDEQCWQLNRKGLSVLQNAGSGS
jgi:peptidoglycan-associated lipoprotein